jgi:hypothetical protein
MVDIALIGQTGAGNAPEYVRPQLLLLDRRGVKVLIPDQCRTITHQDPTAVAVMINLLGTASTTSALTGSPANEPSFVPGDGDGGKCVSGNT